MLPTAEQITRKLPKPNYNVKKPFLAPLKKPLPLSFEDNTEPIRNRKNPVAKQVKPNPYARVKTPIKHLENKIPIEKSPDYQKPISRNPYARKPIGKTNHDKNLSDEKKPYVPIVRRESPYYQLIRPAGKPTPNNPNYPPPINHRNPYAKAVKPLPKWSDYFAKGVKELDEWSPYGREKANDYDRLRRNRVRGVENKPDNPFRRGRVSQVRQEALAAVQE